MPGRMKNPSISGEDGFISILIDDTLPANKKGVIVKNKKSTQEKYFMKATGYDELKGYLYFTVYEAGKLDTDQEFMKSEDLDFMHLDLMKNMKSTKMADINHDMNRLNDVYLMEIWKETDENDNTIAIKGAYYIKENELLMEKAKENKINGVSICGVVEDIIEEPLSKSENSMIKDIWNKLFGKEEIIIKEDKTMDEKLKEFIETDEKAEDKLKELGYVKEKDGNTDDDQSGNTDDGSTTDDNQDGSTDNNDTEELTAESNEILEEKEAKITELEKEIETLKAEKDELIKMKKGSKVEDGQDVKERVKQDFKEKFKL